MRAILTCLPYYSHLVPVLIPVAKALRRAGHTVAVASAPAMADELARAGVEHLPLPNVLTLRQLLDDPEFAGSPGMPAAPPADPAEAARARARPGRLTQARAGALAGIFARDLIAVAGSWRPDVIVRECNEFGGYLAAQRLGLPGAVLDIAPLAALNLPLVHDAVNGARVDLGLDPVDDPWHPLRGLLAGLVPLPWYPAALPVRPVRSYRADPEAAPLDPVFAGLPDDRPLVLASLGTVAAVVAPESERLLATMIDALGRLRCTAVVVGDAAEAAGAAGARRPANVRVVPSRPLGPLLGTAELVLSHGGFGSVREALRGGTPMVNLPMFGDQPGNAERIEELGLGLRADPQAATPPLLAGVCERVLTEPSFRYRAAGMARRMLADPGYDVLAEDLAALA